MWEVLCSPLRAAGVAAPASCELGSDSSLLACAPVPPRLAARKQDLPAQQQQTAEKKLRGGARLLTARTELLH